MSRDLNRCCFIGRLGQDPEVRFMPDGTGVANFSIAVGNEYKDKNTGNKVEQTEWVKISAFGKLAEIIREYLKKGSQVYIEGKMKTRKWEKDGQAHYTTEIIADNMQMLGGKGGEQPPLSKRDHPPQSGGPDDDFDSTVPF